MESRFKGTLWTTLVLVTLPHLTGHMLCPASCLCGSDGAVQCGGNTIADVPELLPVNAYLLKLNATNITVIDEQSLANKTLLLRFSLTSSRLHTIHPGAFHVAPQLKSVKLSCNHLSTLPAGVFSPLKTLEQLHVDSNQLETIAPDMFKGLGGLIDLDLSSNRLSSLASGLFDGLTNLTKLNLCKNSIKKFPPTIFHNLTNLCMLAICFNELEVLEAGIFDDLVNLEELKMYRNKITSLPRHVFWALRNLKTLSLSFNRLQAIPEKSFYNMPKLIKLTIFNNPLLSLPKQLMGHMPDMTEFYLSATNLATVPGNLFANMSGLRNLKFNYNTQLRELPSDLFCCNPKLQTLTLTSNDLRYLHPQLFSRLTKLMELLIDHNELQSLPDNIFQGAVSLKKLKMGGNPWNCVCSTIGKWMKQNHLVVADRDKVICHSPAHRVNQTLLSLLEEEIDFCDGRIFTSAHSSTIPTSRPTTTAASPTTPPTQTSGSIRAAPRGFTIPTNAPTTKPAALTTTVRPTSFQSPTITLPDNGFLDIPETPSSPCSAPAFYDTLVVEQGPEFVHHSRLKSWVYLWFLPSDAALTGFLLFCYILLLATGLILIVAAMFCMYLLNKTMDQLKSEVEHPPG
ncbi:gp5 [Pungitius sinensis]